MKQEKVKSVSDLFFVQQDTGYINTGVPQEVPGIFSREISKKMVPKYFRVLHRIRAEKPMDYWKKRIGLPYSLSFSGSTSSISSLFFFRDQK